MKRRTLLSLLTFSLLSTSMRAHQPVPVLETTDVDEYEQMFRYWCPTPDMITEARRKGRIIPLLPSRDEIDWDDI